jgi:hypothetical protein
MRHAGVVLLWVAAASVLMCAAQPDTRTTIRLTVPREVSAQAESRAAGNASSPPPILVLEGVEIGNEEGLTILVLGPEAASGKPRPILGQAATVGLPQEIPKEPLQKMTLAVPLNDTASRLLAGKSTVSLTLALEGSPGRPPLKLQRAYFDPGEPPSQ